MLTYETAVAAAREIVARHPDGFRYSSGGRVGGLLLNSYPLCLYVPRTDPRAPESDQPLAEASAVTGCLVGEILALTGHMTDEVAGSTGRIGTLIDKHVVHAHRRAATFLSHLQSHQDGGETWTTALRLAIAQTERASEAPN